MNRETSQFIHEHAGADIHQLLLQSSRFPLVDMPLAIRQIAGRQKIQHKVPLFYNTSEILYPAQLSLEQASSETTAQYKSSLCEGNLLVDLTGGFGVDCCFMSAHFSKAVYVERQSELCDLAKHNFSALGFQHIAVVNCETEKYLSEMEMADWIFIDPARRSISGKKVVMLTDCEPDVTALLPVLKAKAKRIMLKLSPMMDISVVLEQLSCVTEVHIVAVENECKEILLIIGSHKNELIRIKTVNFLKNNQKHFFEFELGEEQQAVSLFSSEIQRYLYEPNAAIMKSGAFKLIGSKFGLRKLNKNTHLYTSDELISDFPGRILEVQKIWGNSKKEWKKNLEKISKANISTRNYPIQVDELRSKLKLKDGGDTYLYACTLANEEKTIIELVKLK